MQIQLRITSLILCPPPSSLVCWTPEASHKLSCSTKQAFLTRRWWFLSPW